MVEIVIKIQVWSTLKPSADTLFLYPFIKYWVFTSMGPNLYCFQYESSQNIIDIYIQQKKT